MRLCFSDLDGTFLDHESYSYQFSLPGFRLLRDNGIPLIFVSSKTFEEIRDLQLELQNGSPFIFENGAGLGFCNPETGYSYELLVSFDDHSLIQVKSILQNGSYGKVTFFDQMSAAQLSRLTGLSEKRAAYSLHRRGTLPFHTDIHDLSLDRVNAVTEPYDIQVTRGGRFYHLLPKSCSKGNAIKLLIEKCFSNAQNDNLTMGVGDSVNDLPMLEVVDYPFLVRKYDGSILSEPRFVSVDESGPAGFTSAVQSFLKIGIPQKPDL
ncbi:MAG: HAD-IIB family hydrolase [Spirochaetes bacterium]|jgi:mannosyl-3-phosphoglycerate phosphatase|nr:HAD-IIB family hydrolase [Spirochaetota bacterium]